MEKTFFFRTGELVWEEIFDLTFFFFVIIFTLFSVCPFLKFGYQNVGNFMWISKKKKKYPYILFRGDVHLFSLIYTQVSKLRTFVT